MRRFSVVPAIVPPLICVIYVSLAVVAFVKYPVAYSPVDNWLSDLGNRVISPQGSLFYNAGVIVSGVLLALFFADLGRIGLSSSRVQRLVVVLSQAFGAIGGIGMVLSAVFSIERPGLHSAMSAVFRIGVGTAFGLSVAVLSYQAAARKWIMFVGGATTLLDLIVSLLFNRTQILEWPVISLFLVYSVLLGLEVRRVSSARASASRSAS